MKLSRSVYAALGVFLLSGAALAEDGAAAEGGIDRLPPSAEASPAAADPALPAPAESADVGAADAEKNDAERSEADKAREASEAATSAPPADPEIAPAAGSSSI